MAGVSRSMIKRGWPLLWLALFLQGCGENSVSTQAETARMPPAEASPVSAESIASLRSELAMAADVSAIKKLQKAYGYYLDKGMWTDLVEFFTEDAVANYPAGVYVGKDSIRQHLYRNVGSVEVGEVGLGDGRLYNHINMQPVVHLDRGGDTARGRWRAQAMFGSWGAPSGMWAEGIYNMSYRKVDGVWKIAHLDYHSGYGAPYTDGWGANPDAPARSRGLRNLPHPADRERQMDCEGFPEACIIPFHYDNLGSSDDAQVWHRQEPPVSSAAGQDGAETASAPAVNAEAEVATLRHRAQLLKDELELENLQRIYGYYLDRAQWDQVADLFAEEGSLEYAQMGIYEGPQRIREFFGLFGEQGLEDGWLFDHVQLQTLVTVAPDGKTAKARSREWGMTGKHGSHGHWHDGIYENTFVKEEGVWKIQSVHYYPTYITDYSKGWTQDAQPAPGINAQLPPDAPPSTTYEIFPKAHVPAFHYPNPITGREAVYPAVGAPEDASIAATRLDLRPYTPPPVEDVAQAMIETRALLQAVKDHHEIENLENAYGYYLDKNLWNDLADLFAEDGSMELAQRGVYRGRERVREFLFTVFGDEGPVAGRLGNHLHMQPVIHVSEDGQRAQVRSRMMQQLSFSGRPSMGAAIYQNELIREEGRWKFLSTHALNTFTAAYDGGWISSQSRGVPGPSAALPPDAPPSVVFDMFPNVYDIPYHYPNPVSGR